MNQVEIRRAVLNDVSAVAEVHIRSHEAAYTGIIPPAKLAQMCAAQPERRKENLSREDHTTHVALWEGKVVGLFNFGPCHNEALSGRCYQLYAIYLHPEYHRRGIGRAMMDYAEKQARLQGKSAMVLWVFEENTPARRFYEACGYRLEGTQREDDFGGRLIKGLRYIKELQNES